MLNLFLATAIATGGIILAAACVVALAVGVKKLMSRKQGDGD